ncbi:MAG: putative metal-binding motif-containing protein [Polyangiaceae bacterium]
MASCTVRGQDQDEDGHFSSACLVMPGDDCDDSKSTVYAGAPELCDGLDNDCNSRRDVQDGLLPSGSTFAVGPSGVAASSPKIAWAAEKGRFGITYVELDTPDTNLYFEEVNRNGSVSLAPRPLNDVSSFDWHGGASLAWGGKSFLAAWNGSWLVWLRKIDADGVPSTAISLETKDFTYLERDPEIALTSNGTWGLVYPQLNDGVEALLGYQFSDSLKPIGSVKAISMGDGARANYWDIVATGDRFVVNANTPRLMSASFDESVRLAVTGDAPVLASGRKGFLIATRAADGPRVWLFAPSGGSACGPVAFADESFIPESAVATSSGYLIVSSGKVRVQEVRNDCALGALFTLDAGPASLVSISGGAEGYGVVWDDTALNIAKRRFFGPNYCD